jgi:hypothetical protein
MAVPGLAESAKESQAAGLLQPRLREVMQTVFNSIQEEFRLFLTRPSYAELLRHGYHLILPKRGEYKQRLLEAGGGMAPEEVLLWLAAERISQEYLAQLTKDGDGQFSCGEEEDKVKEGDDEDEEEEERENEEVIKASALTLPADRAEAVFMQWLSGAVPRTVLPVQKRLVLNSISFPHAILMILLKYSSYSGTGE